MVQHLLAAVDRREPRVDERAEVKKATENQHTVAAAVVLPARWISIAAVDARELVAVTWSEVGRRALVELARVTFAGVWCVADLFAGTLLLCEDKNGTFCVGFAVRGFRK